MNKKTLIHERNIALQAIYKRIIHTNVNRNLITNDTIVSIILEEPAPRFYISPHQAELLIIHHRDKKQCASCKRTLKREMVDDLVENFERLRELYPHTPLKKIYEMVVEKPAKSFYISYRCARDIIFNYTGRNGKR